jgi:hypothetical protein
MAPSQIAPADLDFSIFCQAEPVEFPLGDALEPGWL